MKSLAMDSIEDMKKEVGKTMFAPQEDGPESTEQPVDAIPPDQTEEPTDETDNGTN